MPQPRLASHRGGANLWPENSLLAFRQAVKLPVEQLELDVHATADGEPVVLHDATLDRTTDARGPVCERTTRQLRSVRVKGSGGEAVPMLSEVGALLRDGTQELRLELKADRDGRPYPGLLATSMAVLDCHGLRQRTWLMSFQPIYLMQAVAYPGLAGLVLLLESLPWRGMGPAGAVALARACRAQEIGLPLTEVDSQVVGDLRAAGLGVSVWGANDAAQISRALGLGLAAVTTDDPVLAYELRGQVLPPP